MPQSIRIVTVTYNSAAVIGAFLDGLPEGVEVVVVDNASTDATREILGTSGVTVIPLDRNLGFGTACNRGAAGNDKEFVFFVNPDAVLDAECCKRLVAAAARHPEAAAFNPAILNSRGKIRLNRRSEWSDRSLAMDPDAEAQVNILSGAALFCRQAAFEAVGGFDERIFLYHEDDDLCLRLRQKGWTLRLNHKAKAAHLGGASSGGSRRGTYLKAYHIAQSRMYVERKHGVPLAGLRAWGRALAKLLSPLNLVSGRKRAQAMGYLNGTRSFAPVEYGHARPRP